MQNRQIYVLLVLCVRRIRIQIDNLFDDGCHVIVLVFGEAAAEDNVGFLGSKLAVLIGEGVVTVVVHGVIGLHAFLVLGAVLFADDGIGAVVDFLTEHLEVLVLDDSGVGFIVTGVVNHCVALVVGGVLDTGLEGDGAPVELSKTIVEILVKLTCIYEIAGNLFPCFFYRTRITTNCTQIIENFFFPRPRIRRI